MASIASGLMGYLIRDMKAISRVALVIGGLLMVIPGTVSYTHLAMKKQNHEDYSMDAAMAKLFAAETASDVTRRAVQLFGGYGYTREYPVERMMRDAKITEILTK